MLLSSGSSYVTESNSTIHCPIHTAAWLDITSHHIPSFPSTTSSYHRPNPQSTTASSQSPTPMKHRAVVASFIFWPPAEPDATAPTHVALFRRSQNPNVRSYRGLLAPISGSIDAGQDASPRAAAARELREETTLVADRDLRLEAVGPPFSFADEKAGRSWTVYPFGWGLLCAEERLRLDWEHDGWEWVEVSELLGGDAGGGFGLRERCVPRVEESLRRVYFGDGGVFGGDELMKGRMPVGDVFYQGMQALRDDKENGARVLATRAVQCVREIVQALGETICGDDLNRQRSWKLLKIAGWHLVYSARPSMNAAIGSAIVETLASIQLTIRETANTNDPVTRQLQEAISRRQSAPTRLAKEFSKYVGQQEGQAATIRLVTLSSSSTIKAALLDLIDKGDFKSVSISILESRPRCEGASLAASLITALKEAKSSPGSANTRVSITIAPDSHLPSLLSPTPSDSERVSRTYLLLGADRISPHGAVLNKTISLSAAALAKASTPDKAVVTVVVLAETDKLATIADLELFRADEPRSQEREMSAHEPEHGGVDEVMDAWSAAGVAENDRRVVQDAIAIEGKDEGSAVTVSIQNETFEWVPARQVDAYITEKGEMGRHEIGEHCVRKTELESRVFTALYE